MKVYNNIIVTGSIAFDEIMNFPGKFVDYFLPKKLHQINVSFALSKIERQLGGVALNLGYNLTLVSKKKIIILGALGRDGEPFRQFLKKNNLDDRGVISNQNDYTATGKVITDTNNNQIWGFYYGASSAGKNIDLTEFVGKESLLIMSANHPKAFLHFQEQAINNRFDYVYDYGVTLTWISKNDLINGILNSKYIVGNDYETAMLIKMTGLMIKDLVKRKIKIITTLGPRGVLYQDDKNNYLIKAYRLNKIIDPTGAGDAWRGGFFGGLISGMDIKESLKQANSLSSFAIQKYGTVNHRPSYRQIHDRMKRI